MKNVDDRHGLMRLYDSASGCFARSRNGGRGLRWKKCFHKIPKWSIGVALGVVCLVLGLFEEQFVEIYRKAVMICLECIGIG